MLRRGEPENYLIIYKRYMRYMSIEMAVFISWLQNFKSYQKKTKRIKPGGWFRCSRNAIQDDLGWERNKQDRAFRWLFNNGIIDRCMMGNPARRYVKLDVDGLESYLEKAEERYYRKKGL